MKELLKPRKRLLGGRELRFLAIYSPFVAVLAIACGTLVYLIDIPSAEQLLPVAGMFSGAMVLSGLVSWHFATTLYNKEKDLRENRMLRESFMEKTQSGLFVKDVAGRFLYANDVWARMLNSNNAAVEGKTDYDFFPREQADLMKQQDEAVLSSGERIEFDDILTAADGVSKFMLMKFAMRTHSGRIYAIGSIAHDVTRVLSTEKALQESEHRFETLLDMAPNAIIIAHSSGSIQLVNKQASNLFGLSVTELQNMNVDELLPVEDRERNRLRREEFIRSKAAHISSTDDDLYGQKGNGEKFPIEVALSPVNIGDEVMIMCIIRDVTKQKTALTELSESTRKLQELNEELQLERASLEKRVNQRTKELEREKQRAEEANKAKSLFLATMSHEIRTPMNGVIGTIDVLRQSSLRPKQMEHVEIIKDSAYSLLTVIDDILDFSKIEAGRIELEQEPVVLSYLADSTCSAMLPIAKRKNVQLRFFRDPHLPGAIMSDAVRLRQIIINLVGNAIKFSGGDNTQGMVDVRFELAGNNALCIRVSDNGIGMTEEAIQQVFEPFTQADTSTTRRFGGTGLGLPITKRIVELMHGKLNLESQPGAGTRFEIVLPAKPATDAGHHEAIEQLTNYRCYLLCKDMSVFSDWSNCLRHAGASVTQIASIKTLNLAQMEANAVASSPNVLIAVDDHAHIDTYQEIVSQASDRALHRLVLVRPLEDQTISVENEVFTIIGRHPNLNSTFQYVVSAILGDVDHLLDDLEDNKESQKTITREEAEQTGRMILVAEDNDINQKVIKNQLDLLGYACDIASNGEEALKLWSTNHYSLLLTDLHMPVLDGYELTAAIRRQESNGSKRLPILAFTANATKGERKACIDSGMNDYLPKPVPLENLQQKLTRWTNNAEPASDTSANNAHGGNGVAPVPEKPILDVSVLEKLVGDNQATIREFLQDYRQSSQKSAADIATACKNCDWQQVGALAHALKSSSRSVGALMLGEICADLESAGKNQDEQRINELMSGFRQSLSAVVDSINNRGI